jgi:putative hydrolase of the HAD superfamily
MTGKGDQGAELVRRIRARLAPLDPLPTGLTPSISRLQGIRSVVFDIYGTLMLSAAGDIAVHEASTRGDAVMDGVRAAGFSVSADATTLDRAWHQEIARAHAAAHARGITHPEIDIRAIWQAVAKDGMIAPPPGTGVEAYAALAVEVEMRLNVVALEPTARETLASLAARGLSLGIVSNAQFYTPLIFETLLERSLTDAGFSDDLRVWSWEQGEGKPSTRLYELLVERLAARGIAPHQVLYVGNDMLKDMVPAAACGLRTALYAGDRRSLRLRENHPACRASAPDRVITTLHQVLAMV